MINPQENTFSQPTIPSKQRLPWVSPEIAVLKLFETAGGIEAIAESNEGIIS